MAIMIKLHETPDYYRATATGWQRVASAQAALARHHMSKRRWLEAAKWQRASAYSYEVARLALLALLRTE